MLLYLAASAVGEKKSVELALCEKFLGIVKSLIPWLDWTRLCPAPAEVVGLLFGSPSLDINGA